MLALIYFSLAWVHFTLVHRYDFITVNGRIFGAATLGVGDFSTSA